MRQCPKCDETTKQVKAGKTEVGSQRINCQNCKTRYTPDPKERGYPDEVRVQAIWMYVDGINYRRIARHLKVSHVNVIN
jgi:transposase-like protein